MRMKMESIVMTTMMRMMMMMMPMKKTMRLCHVLVKVGIMTSTNKLTMMMLWMIVTLEMANDDDNLDDRNNANGR